MNIVTLNASERFSLWLKYFHFYRGVLLPEGQAPVRPTALLLPGDGLRAVLHDGVRLLDVLLAGPQGGKTTRGSAASKLNDTII